MHRRLIGAAWLIFALAGCSDDPTRLSVVDELTGARAARTADDKPATAQDLLKKGMEEAQRDELVLAVATLERAHKLDPKDRQILFYLTLARQLRADKLPDGKDQLAMSLAATESARTLRALAGAEPTPNEKGIVALALFNEARVYARNGQPDKALASLAEAIDGGFLNEKLLADDKALDSLRDRPEFARLVGRVKESVEKVVKVRRDAIAKQMLPEVKEGLPSFKPFPFDFELPGLDGKPVKLADYKGKVTVVDIWGTWCPPCRLEIPHFVELLKNYRDKGVEIVGLNYEKVPPDKIKETIESFVKETGINYTLAIGDDKTTDLVPDFSSFPTTLFLDRQGKVRYMHVGYAPYEVIEYIVKTLLDDKPSAP